MNGSSRLTPHLSSLVRREAGKMVTDCASDVRAGQTARHARLFDQFRSGAILADETIWSPNHSRALVVDTSGRRDTISIKSGSKNIRLFYGHFGDALDAWKTRERIAGNQRPVTKSL